MRRGRTTEAGLLAGSLALGLAAERFGPAWGDPQLWLPDLAVGLAYLGAATHVWARGRADGLAALLAAVGLTWLVPVGGLLQLHRGPLVHLLVTYPGARPRGRVASAAVASGWLVALVPEAWGSDPVALALALLLVLVCARSAVVARGPLRRARAAALAVAVALAAALVAGDVVRSLLPADPGVRIALHVYEGLLAAAALALARLRPGATAGALTDRLAGPEVPGPTSLQGRLADVLGDPDLRLGYWSAEAGCYLDELGRPVDADVRAGGRVATEIGGPDGRVALLLHDRQVLADQPLAGAVTGVIRLAASAAALQTEVGRRREDLLEARRRLLAAEVDERRRLAGRLAAGPGRHLDGASARLERLDPDDGLTAVRARLDGVRGQLASAVRGLHPQDLADTGLTDALPALAARCPLPVRLVVEVPRLPLPVEVAAYFVCAEALTNAAKHSGGAGVQLTADVRDGRLRVEVRDDGRGGADAGRGSGLRGLAERVSALGGTLLVESPLAGGTRVSAQIPAGPGAGPTGDERGGQPAPPMRFQGTDT